MTSYMACGSVDIQGTFEAKGVSNAKSRLQFVAAEVRLCLLSLPWRRPPLSARQPHCELVHPSADSDTLDRALRLPCRGVDSFATGQTCTAACQNECAPQSLQCRLCCVCAKDTVHACVRTGPPVSAAAHLQVREPFPAAVAEAGVDTLVMKHFLSGFSDADAALILKHCAAVLAPDGRILLLQVRILQ